MLKTTPTNARTQRWRRLKEVNKILSTIRRPIFTLPRSQNLNSGSSYNRVNSNNDSVHVSVAISSNLQVVVAPRIDELNRNDRVANYLQDLNEFRPNSDTFTFSLRKWTLDNNIKHTALGSLLKLLNMREGNLPNLPIDPRTLMCTPANPDIKNMSNGSYFYFGIRQQIIKKIKYGLNEAHNVAIPVLKQIQSSVFHPVITISVGID